MLTNQYRRLPCSSITIRRDERQRSDIDTSSIIDSIRRIGVLVPILVTNDNVLVAGERRLTASLELGLPDIPCRFVSATATPIELQIIELEENARRTDLCWQDQCRAFATLHELYKSQNPAWTTTNTGEALGYTQESVSNKVRVAAELGDKKIAEMPTYTAALNFLFRKDARGIDNAMSMIMEAGLSIGDKLTATIPGDGVDEELLKLPSDFPILAPAPKAPLVVGPQSADESILLEDFLKWAPSYNGQKFNFLHFDPPYGIGLFKGKQSGHERADATYNDDENTFWGLVDCLCEHRDNILQASAHIMFWFSMDYYSDIIARLARSAPELVVNPFPLIWHKSCGTGITPDPRRGAKRSYETALLISRGDRFVCSAVANLYSAPTDKKYHPSTKPEPMLRHFFRLFVDEHTRMLDPTCGSGSSLRAAESLGAKHTLGLEKDPTFHKGACEALRNFRITAAANKRMGA